MTSQHLALCALFVVLSAAVQAQATLPITGTVQDDAENMHLIEVDFGAVAQSITLTLEIAATSGISGLDAALIDLDELALAGTATGMDSGGNSGTGTFTVSLTTPSYDGVRQFAVILETWSLDGPSSYSGNLETPDLAAGSLVQTGFNVHVGRPGFFTFWGRSARFAQQLSSASTLSRTVQIDFGATPQAMTFWVQGAGFGADGTVEVYEILGNGTPVLLGSVSGSVIWTSEDNLTTSVRDGVVTLRFDLVVAGSGIFGWQIVTPGTVSIQQPAGGGKKKGGNCSTDDGRGTGLAAILAALAAAACISRLRPARSA